MYLNFTAEKGGPLESSCDVFCTQGVITYNTFWAVVGKYVHIFDIHPLPQVCNINKVHNWRALECTHTLRIGTESRDVFDFMVTDLKI